MKTTTEPEPTSAEDVAQTLRIGKRDFYLYIFGPYELVDGDISMSKIGYMRFAGGIEGLYHKYNSHIAVYLPKG